MATSQVQALDLILLNIAFENGDDVGNTVAGVQHGTCPLTLGHQCQQCLVLEEHAGEAVPLEHDFTHLLAIFHWVLGCLSQQDAML